MGTNTSKRPPTTKRAPPPSPLDALFGTTQQRVLGLLFGHPDRSFFANELIARTGSGSGAVQRELARLCQSGLVTSRNVGRQRHYQANVASPIYEELHSIVIKTVGAAEPLRAALLSLAGRISVALLYGSVAKGTATADSDVDLLVVANDLTLEELYSALSEAEQRLSRKIHPTVYTEHEFEKRLRARNSFLTRMLSGTYITLIGDPRVIERAR
jgi:predicted nucleotidyltransferase